MSDKIELIYFDLQGRATLIRMLMRMSGCEWKDTRIPANKEAWLEHKPKIMEDALGAVPVLKLNDQGKGVTESFRMLFQVIEFSHTQAKECLNLCFLSTGNLVSIIFSLS